MKSNAAHEKKGTGGQGSKNNEVARPRTLRKPAKLEVRAEDEALIIRLPRFQTPTRSRSGKSLLVATTGGVKRTPLLVHGSPVYIVANAFFYDSERRTTAEFVPLFEMKGGSDDPKIEDADFEY
jgi:hypothetical protein